MKASNPTLLMCLLGAALGTGAIADAATQEQARTVEEQKTMPPPRDSDFARMDANQDGRIAANEADADAKVSMAFGDLDTDDDGFVSAVEFTAYKTASPPAAPPTAQGAQHAAEHSAVATRETFGSLDRDKDGRVSSTEAGSDAGFDAGFAAMDANGDGFVSDTEYRAQSKSNAKMEDRQPGGGRREL